MVDPASLAEGVAIFKSGMDGLKLALGIVRDVKGSLPADANAQLTIALDQSEQALQIPQAQIAIGLGFPLCRCHYPGTPMLTVGRQRTRGDSPQGFTWIPLHECPRCGLHDAQPGTSIERRDKPTIVSG